MTQAKQLEIALHKVEGLDLGFQKTENLSFMAWASKYLEAECIGVQSENTVDAKKRDLSAFLKWYYEENGHLLIEEWLPRDTQGFLGYLEKMNRAPATINRILATLRRFARWTNEQPESPFVGGLPTHGVKDLETEEPDAQKLSTREMNRLFKAADKMVLTETHKKARPVRNRTILALLYYTGLRVSELCALNLSQLEGKHLVNVRRKGRNRARKVYLSSDCRAYLEEYVTTERLKDDPGTELEPLLLAYNSDKHITRMLVWRVLEKMAKEASAHTKDNLKIHPHRLRHTFGFEVRQRTGSDTETAALLGHTGLKYVGRYVRRTDEEREEILDDL